MVIVTLTRPISILYPAYFFIINIFFHRGSLSRRLFRIGAMLLIFTAGIAPWMYRGYKITGNIIPLVSYRSTTLFQNESEGGKSVHSSKHPGFVNKFKTEIQNPLLFLRNALKRLIRFWYYGHSTTVRLVNAVLQFPLLALSIFGIWVAKKQGILIFPVLSTVCYFWLAYSATHAISRYSFPMIALLCPFVAFGANEILESLKSRLSQQD